MYQGQTLRVVVDEQHNFAELCFDRQDASANKFDQATLSELKAAGEWLQQATSLQGLIVSSAKDSFIVGADITEFGGIFKRPEDEIAAWVLQANQVFNAIEDLPYPSCTAINGVALGGGFEMCLATDYRVMSADAQLGFPEVKLGIYPGFGGTVRAPRLIGADTAIEWIAQGSSIRADAALKAHAVDAVVAPDRLRAAAISLLQQAVAGKYDWRARRAQKTAPLGLSPMEAMMVFETAKGYIAGQAGKHYPAPLEAVKTIQKAASKSRDEALVIEGRGFAKMAKTPQADALSGLFLNDQFLKRKAKGFARTGKPVRHAAVLGAGIMGGGIAYTSAVKGTPILMKDIAEPQLALGMNEANKLLAKQVERQKLTPEKAGHILASIRPTLNYGDFGGVDLVVEAVVENPKVKKAVLAEVEAVVQPGTIITSNTSSISIEDLASAVRAPENFLGMHFFNPVHRMPLVEVIHGPKTSQEAIATVCNYASAMGKTPIVVRNCPGFLVNRILFPYLAGWEFAISAGADLVKVDRVMEDFGWPMGPAYLGDVVGIDTLHHVGQVLAEGYPDRMSRTQRTAVDVMYEAQRFGQKNGVGFYRYETDPKGKPRKVPDPAVAEMLQAVQPGGVRDMSEAEIVERLMLPMIIETARCVEEGIVDNAIEADMGLILGVGFPPFIGGALKYADQLGLQAVVTSAARYADLGRLYQPTPRMLEMAAAGRTYYSV